MNFLETDVPPHGRDKTLLLPAQDGVRAGLGFFYSW